MLIKKNAKKLMQFNWIFKMLWRDSRSQFKRLFLYVSSIILGTAALVSIRSISENLETAIEVQSKSLLGADLRISSPKAFTAGSDSIFATLSNDQSRLYQFVSMAYLEKTETFRFSSIRAIDGDFPYYGDIVTEPTEASTEFRTGRHTIIDESLAFQLGASIGDSLKIGTIKFKIVGTIQKIPGESFAVASAAPRIFIPMSELDATKLIQPGSIVNYNALFKLDNSVNVDTLINNLKPHMKEERQRSRTAGQQQGRVSDSMGNLYRFLNLIGFIALILGSVGVASSIHVYIKDKINSVAVLHCIGAKSKQTLSIYILQAALMGVIGAFSGAVLGVFIQYLIPEIMKEFMPVELDMFISWSSIVFGFFISLGMSILFALLPLLKIRNISPLRALRIEVSDDTKPEKLRWLIYLAIFLFIFLFAYYQASTIQLAIGFTLFLLISFAALYLTAKISIFIVKRLFPKSWPYTFRQSLLNLFRPNNQTITMISSIGLGVFLICTLFLSQESLYNFVAISEDGERPNIVIFDIQSDQKDPVIDILQKNNLSGIINYPIVTMRLSKLKGIPSDSILADSNTTIPRWSLSREYRSTFRSKLNSSETLIEGKLQTIIDNPTDSIFISLAEGFAKNIDVKLGDELVFNVQGVNFKTYVGSLRKVDWRRVQPNFLVVFPEGVLEYAPLTHVATARVKDKNQSAMVQRDLVKKFPNISAIDLSLIMEIVEGIVDKIAYVIRFMALFSIITGITVLIAAIISSRFQRSKESILIRTLGAKRRQIQTILVGEYFFLASIAGVTGISLSIVSTWILTTYVFKTVFNPSIMPLLIIFVSVIFLIVSIGVFLNRSLLSRSPLEVFRQEVF